METDEQTEQITPREQFVRDKVVELFGVMNKHQHFWSPDGYTYEDVEKIMPQAQAYRALVEHLYPEDAQS